jgi:hypothetical protein
MLKRGMRIVAVGKLVERSFTATRGEHQGETIRRHELIVDEIGVALRFATATVTRATSASAAEGDDTAA